MAVPDYQALMKPLLLFAADGNVHTGAESVAHVAELFELTPEERAQLLPSGRTRTLNNRTHWALTYLRHAALLSSEGHGKYRITERGMQLLNVDPPKVDKALLIERYPEIIDFIGAGKAKASQAGASAAPDEPVTSSLTPEEQLEASYRSLRSELEGALLAKLKAGSPEFFERAVLEVLVAMGYGGSRLEAALHVGKSSDGGIDGVINEDKLGLDKVYVQAKRWEGVVGRPTVQGFAGSLDSEHARKGVLITTSSFSGDARAYVQNIEKRIVLISGDELVQHMVDYRVGVQPRGTFTVYRMDEDFFEEAD
jgi:restriction system protein